MITKDEGRVWAGESSLLLRYHGFMGLDQTREEKAKWYAREHFRLMLLSFGVELAILVALLISGASVWWAGRVTAASGWRAAPAAVVLLYTAGLGVLLKLAETPFSVLSRRIEIRYGLNRQSRTGWLWDQTKSTLIGAALALGGLELVYWLLRATPKIWWLWAWGAFVLFAIALAQLAPVLLLPLFFKFRPLSTEGKEAELVERLSRLSERAGTRVRGVFEWKLGEKSAKANAALTGLGATRRVIISDTLLNSAAPDEIEAVFAHELGHHVHRHIWYGLAFQMALSFLGFWLADVALRFFEGPLHLVGIADIAGLPLLFLVAMVISALLLPIANAFSRRMERQADDYAFAAVGDAEPLVRGLQRLADQNLAERHPPRWKEFIFYSHPSISTRLTRASAWQAARGKTR
ncbi:MAG: M48 family metallopeptidase [Terriglobia bacterium]